jgi:archaemetzincin
MSEIVSSKPYELLIVPVGRHTAERLPLLCYRLEQIYQRVHCNVLEAPAIPEHYYDALMKAYVAKKVLSLLVETYGCKTGKKILGITDVDLCLLDTNVPCYLFGLARPSGNVALISSHRLNADPPDKDQESLLVERMSKEAMHELGHLSDLDHCHNESCTMTGSITRRGIDQKRLWYCLRCKEHAPVQTDDDSVLNWIQPYL